MNNILANCKICEIPNYIFGLVYDIVLVHSDPDIVFQIYPRIYLLLYSLFPLHTISHDFIMADHGIVLYHSDPNIVFQIITNTYTILFLSQITKFVFSETYHNLLLAFITVYIFLECSFRGKNGHSKS